MERGDDMEQNINAFIHHTIRRHEDRRLLAIDATCGNGHDTLLLAELYDQVIGFDIQPVALDATAKRLRQAGYDNVKLVLDSHALMERHLGEDSIDLAVFNLGYLPHGDKTIITTPDATMAAVETILRHLAIRGLIAITVYTGHPGGQLEADALTAMLKDLDKHDYTVIVHRYLNRRQAPFAILIERMQ